MRHNTISGIILCGLNLNRHSICQCMAAKTHLQGRVHVDMNASPSMGLSARVSKGYTIL